MADMSGEPQSGKSPLTREDLLKKAGAAAFAVSMFGALPEKALGFYGPLRYQQKQLSDGLAGWIRPVELASGGLLLLMAVAVIVLLALPASHPFFRKQQEQWAPPSYPTV